MKAEALEMPSDNEVRELIGQLREKSQDLERRSQTEGNTSYLFEAAELCGYVAILKLEIGDPKGAAIQHGHAARYLREYLDRPLSMEERIEVVGLKYQHDLSSFLIRERMEEHEGRIHQNRRRLCLDLGQAIDGAIKMKRFTGQKELWENRIQKLQEYRDEYNPSGRK
ncbi:hypothetical protein COV20_03215 [Candidatus Woesearchaeota archaeon CG10_big_fil_rev_8_21_14_0_10_45_16]|nr:MAG: hypothetical protein COV20_03215 [Candidatus Woesearchaeota archaeon CG10_big_fil_rev_8_21_14_0_10_45_16]